MLMTPKSRAADNVPAACSQSTPDFANRQDPSLKHLQRDINSPSASLRMRAIQALKNPSKSTYNNFDVPHEEMSIITVDERNPPALPSLTEILKDVIVYVEVRTGNDNRSEGVKSIISKLGAQVNDRLLRNTTHVVFKEGLLSTYKRAQSWNIPIVSILWIEACKVQQRLCDPLQFPISNIHMYEYPELYGKLSRVRCIQPNSELNRRRRRPETPTGGSNAELTPRSATRATPKVTPKAIESTTPTTTQQRTIQSFFTPVSQRKNLCGHGNVPSPATVLLNKINNGCYSLVPVQDEESSSCPNEVGSDFVATVSNDECMENTRQSLRKSRSNSATLETCKGVNQTRLSRRRSLAMGFSTPESNIEQVNQTRRRTLSLSTTGEQKDTLPPMAELEPRMTRRRSSLFNCGKVPESPVPDQSETSRSRSLSNSSIQEPKTPKIVKVPSFTAIVEEPGDKVQVSLEISSELSAPAHSKTNYLHQTMEISASRADIQSRATERRTLYTTARMEVSEVNNENINPYLQLKEADIKFDSSTQTTWDSQDENTPVPKFSSTRLPGSANSSNRRRTLFSVDMEHINERINEINTKSQRRSLALASEAERGESRALAPLQAVPPLNNGHNESNTQPRMRRLFTPNEEVVLTPLQPVPRSRSSSTSGTSNKSTVTVRRRSVTAKPKPLAAVGPTLQEEHDDTGPTTDSKEFVSPYDSEIGDNISDLPGDSTVPPAKRRLLNTLVHTNMHKEQVQVIHKAIRKLRGMRLDPTVTKRTTHLVSLEPRRTLNLLRGLMRGVWIVSYKWVLESMRVGKWVDEEKYELNSFSRAVEICRTERQAFGQAYRCELFRFMETFYVSSLCRPITFNNIKELLLLGGATLTENRYKAKFIIGDKRRAEDDRIYLSPLWVLDSISAMQVQRFGKYLMKSAIVTPYGIRYEDPSYDDDDEPSQAHHRAARVSYNDPTLVMNK